MIITALRKIKTEIRDTKKSIRKDACHSILLKYFKLRRQNRSCKICF